MNGKCILTVYCVQYGYIKDNKAEAPVKNTLVVGHVPAQLSVLFCQFLSTCRTCNKGAVEVTGAVVNCGAGLVWGPD